MGNADYFADIETTDRAGSNSGNWFSDGTYLTEVRKFIAKVSDNDKEHEDEVVTIVECVILEVLRKLENSNKVGDKVAFINYLPRNGKGKLTQKGMYAMERVKNFAAAALGGVGDDAIDAATVGMLTEADPENNIGEGEALKGLRLVADAVTKTSRKSGKAFTNVTWEFAGAENEAA